MARAARKTRSSRRRAPAPALRVVAPAPAPDVERINALNCGLIVLSAALAWALPFDLLLLSYGVLGPLHYLTQISGSTTAAGSPPAGGTCCR